uniref:Uncharacterized protein n=1 Tax=Meloidogyne enterolobii TaxID=390850 RepID=A0A6V7WLH0_MELEN|nr:unnamed protein product [Meloidogyne enterolobii]
MDLHIKNTTKYGAVSRPIVTSQSKFLLSSRLLSSRHIRIQNMYLDVLDRPNNN